MPKASADLCIHFAHSAYRLHDHFKARNLGIASFQSWTPEETAAQIGRGDVLVISGFWRNEFLSRAQKVRFIQICAAGFDQFDLESLRAAGIRLANASGCNKTAVSEHAMALLLAFTRQIHIGRDNQQRHHWRGMISDNARREDELAGKTMLIYGLGKIGQRLARLAKAFDMTVIAIKRDCATRHDEVDELHPPGALIPLLSRSDVVVLTCPLTPATANLINDATLAAMKPTAILINVARGGCVDENALIEALETGRIAGACIDTVIGEPLAMESPLWAMENVVLTPHTAGETRKYEDNVIDILLENLQRLEHTQSELVNQIV